MVDENKEREAGLETKNQQTCPCENKSKFRTPDYITNIVPAPQRLSAEILKHQIPLARMNPMAMAMMSAAQGAKLGDSEDGWIYTLPWARN